jgi:thymidylate synthase (FAD)
MSLGEPNYTQPGVLSMSVLDKGFVALRNVSGPTRRAQTLKTWAGVDSAHPRAYDADDVDPAQAARMSFGQMDSERTREDDMRLNRYLLKNEHATPFEMIQVWLEWKVPIFVDRQFVRHGTIRRNEESGRYKTLSPDWYIPEVVGGKSADKKQGQEDNLSEQDQAAFRHMLDRQCRASYDLYTEALAMGVAPEHARMFLHVNHYVHYVTTVNLRNLFNFMRLRCHSHAQIEARKYGEAVVTLLREPLPGLMGLFDELVRKPE